MPVYKISVGNLLHFMFEYIGKFISNEALLNELECICQIINELRRKAEIIVVET